MFVRPCAKRGGGGPSREARWWRGARFDAFTSGEGVSPRPKASIHFHRQHFVECPNPHHHLRSLRSLDGPLPARNAGGGRMKSGQLAFPACPADINGREVGGGRATRQPGQVRKEAALTSAVRVARQPPTLLRLFIARCAVISTDPHLIPPPCRGRKETADHLLPPPERGRVGVGVRKTRSRRLQ